MFYYVRNIALNMIIQRYIVIFAGKLKDLGCNYVCVSSAGNTPRPKLTLLYIEDFLVIIIPKDL